MVITTLFWICLCGSFISILLGQQIVFAAQLIAAGLFAVAATIQGKTEVAATSEVSQKNTD